MERHWQPRAAGASVARAAIALFLVAFFTSCGDREEEPSAPDTASELTWKWGYDTEGRLAESVGPGGATTRLTYAQSEAAPGATTLTVDLGTEERTFTRDAQGRLLRAESLEGAIEISYSPSGTPETVRTDHAPPLHYTYDVQDRLTELKIGEGSAIGYRYDYLGRPAAISTPAGDVTFSYDHATNTVVRRLPNGIQTFREYDDEGKLIELSHVDAENHIIARYAYAYRPDGLIGEITEQDQRGEARVCRYAYDSMQRLTAVDCGGNGRSYRFAYDSLGNLAESETGAGEALRFSSTAAGALTSDSRGEVRTDERGHIRQLPGSPEPIDYEFDAAGEVSAAKRKTLQYKYNAVGLLTERAVEGRETRYLPDPFADAWQPLWQRYADGTEAAIVWDGPSPLVELRGNEVVYRLEDHLGSVRAEVNGRGDVAAWHDYSPYGAQDNVELGGDLAPAFAGLFWDPVARLYLAKARAYDPVTARFLQPDPQLRAPSAFGQDHSLYMYCGGDPTNLVDRSGAAPERLGTTASGPSTPDHIYQWAWAKGAVEDVGGGVKGTSKSWFGYIADRHVRQVPARYRGMVNTSDWMSKYYVRELRSSRVVGLVGKSGLTALSVVDAAQGAVEAVQEREYGVAALNVSKPFVSRALGALVIAAGAPALPTALAAGAVAYSTGQAYTMADLGVRIATANYRSSLRNDEIMANRIRGVGNLQKSGASSTKIRDYLQSTGMSKIEIDQIVREQAPLGISSGFAGGARAGANSLNPSPVGGVYLGGAGTTLMALGALKGIALDAATGNLVLIGSDEREIALPPLRLDDVVTVFRAVYDFGQSPSVTIDPDEKDPEGPIMRVKHGPGTAGTYVGWVLFECDRIMKTFNLGQDNLTQNPVAWRVPDYEKTLETVYFGGKTNGAKGGTWERFWIVPAAVRRFDAATTDLSLFGLPLKVNTQKMRWQGGKLVDDTRGRSSAGATAFSSWFSQRYDDIAAEVLLAPPPGNGIEGPVPIFAELRRIGLITAIAERLRDLGQAMPLWMRDYKVASFPVSETTPSLTVVKKQSNGRVIQTAEIYGGVNLAPVDADVHMFAEGDVGAAESMPAEDATFVKLSSQQATALASAIPELARADDAVGTVTTVMAPDGKKLAVAVLPGADTRALAPNRQQVTDVVVPIGLGRCIALTRYYHSFFDPVGELGRGWTLDLPELRMTQLPVRRDGKRSQYRVVPHLTSRLGSVDARFDRTERVEPFGVEMHVATDQPEIAGVVSGTNRIVGASTQQVLFRDGTEWHFADDGKLLLVQTDGTATRYVWDSSGRLEQVVGYVGADPVAEIRLAYDPEGRIVQAHAKQADPLSKQAPATGSDLEFAYREDGRLSTVTVPGDAGGARRTEWTYAYEAGLLTKIGGADRVDSSFGYNGRGQLLWENRGTEKTDYTLVTNSEGTVLTRGAGEKWTYDARTRPVGADLGGGSTVSWAYGKGDEVRETVYQDGKALLTRSTSPDGRVETVESNDGPSYELRRDSSGHPTTLARDGAVAMQVAWRPDGTLASVRDADTEITPRRSDEGWPNGVLISAPMKDGKTSAWLEEQRDVMGRPTRISDSSGFEYAMQYDDQGHLLSFGRVTKSGELAGAKVAYDEAGLVTSIDSTWSREKREYSEGGMPRAIEVERQGAKSVSSFDAHGRLTSASAFDGGTTKWVYEADEAGGALKAVELPNGARIDYSRDEGEGASTQQILLGPAVVRTKVDGDGRLLEMTWGQHRP